MVPQGDRRPASRAVPQNRQLAAHQQRPPASQYQPPPREQYRPSASQPFRAQPLPQYDEEDDFPESQVPVQGYQQPPQQMYYPSPSTPAPRRQRQVDPYAPDMSTPQPQAQSMRRPTVVAAGDGVQGGSKAGQLIQCFKDLDPKVDGLVDSTRVVRDTVLDISNGMKVLSSREEMKDDMREYFGPALVQMKSDIMDSIKDIKRDVDDRFRTVSDQLAVLRTAVATMPQQQQQQQVNPGPDKTTTALIDNLIASLRHVDELKNVLLPLNLPQMFQAVCGLGQSLAGLHGKADQTFALVKGIPGAQQTQLAILQRLNQVDARTASQEQAEKDRHALMKKVEGNLNSLQADATTNSQALSAIRKEVETRNEAERAAAWRRSNSVEQSVQTVAPVVYRNSHVDTESSGSLVNSSNQNHAPRSPNVVDIQLLAISPPSSSRPTGTGPDFPSQLSTLPEESAGFAPPPPKRASAKKTPLKRRSNKPKTPASGFDDLPESATSATATPPNDSSIDVFGPVSQVPAPSVATTAASKGKKRKISETSDNPTPGSQRRSARERKLPDRFGQTPAPEEIKSEAADPNVLVPSTQPQPPRPQPPARKRAASKATVTTTPARTIDLTLDRLNSVNSTSTRQISSSSNSSSGPRSPSPPLAAPSTRPNVVLDTQFSALTDIDLDPVHLEPAHITRRSTQSMDPLSRQVFLNNRGEESVSLGDPLREVIEEDEADYSELMTGSQLLGFESE